jgi:hypothetical protein
MIHDIVQLAQNHKFSTTILENEKADLIIPHPIYIL